MRWLGSVVCACIVGAGCSYTTTFHCTTDGDCGTPGGACETGVGYCSFPDPGCASGRRFGSLSGPFADRCVTDGDAGVTCTAGGLPGDLDCDGVLDGADNCPMAANPTQANEDGDRFGDACDPCPPIADDNPLDGDSDGVADGCDPNPAAPGDKLFLFEGFQDGLPASWSHQGTWSSQGGSVTASAGGSHEYIAIAGPKTGHETTSTMVTITANPGTASVAAGVVDEFDSATGEGIECELYSLNTVTPPVGLSLAETAPFKRMSQTAFAIVVGSAQLLKLRRDTTTYGCDVDRSGTTATTTGTSSVTSNPSKIGFRILNTAVRVDWLMVVSSP